METTTFSGMILMLISLAASLYTVHSAFSNRTDQIALLAFKDSVIEDPLRALSSWNSSVNLCQWHGVKCGHRHQRVVELGLRSQRLAGLSPFIGNLSFLRSIYFQDNRFQGNIPQEISNLSHLQNLNFSYNTLQGLVPRNLSFCLDLRILDLKCNNLVGKIPAAFGSISKQNWLSLFGNNLHGTIPPSLGNLALSEKLSFGVNNLGVIDLASNGLSGAVPVDLGRRMNELCWLNLGRNNLGTGVNGDLSFVDSLTNCTKLQTLDLDGNGFGGALPNSVKQYFFFLRRK